jgi:hypothetical protein
MTWMNPQWFAPEALVAEWRRKHVRKRLIGVATTLVVWACLCHPEAAPTALYIDSVGIDVFLAVLEMQLLVGLLLYREQLIAFLRTAYASDDTLGTVIRKTNSLGRYLHEASRGSFRE